MKVAILGARGIPACYSGYDTLVEELSLGLARKRTIQVVVYCRSAYYTDKPPYFQGIRLVYLPAPRLKAIESLLHSFFSTLHVLGQHVDIIYFLDPANAPFCLFLRLFNKRVVLHTNGLGWKRRKWGYLARRYYKFAEWLSSRSAHALVTDNPAMQEYYKNEYGTESVYIPYGAKQHSGVDETVYKELGISPKKYFLVVARLEPENNTDFIIKEYVDSKVDMPLVIVGDSPYNPSYLEHLHKLSNRRVLFIGRVDNQLKLNALYKGAYLYIHGHEVGGTNPSLLRAMQAGTAPLVINVPFNIAVVAECGFAFKKKKGDLSAKLKQFLSEPSTVFEIGNTACTRAESQFKWETVVKAHEKLFNLMFNSKRFN